MKFLVLTIFVNLLPKLAWAVDVDMTYALTDLKMTNFVWKKTGLPGQTIYYFTFENPQGQHILVYDRYNIGAEIEELEFLKTKAGNWTSRAMIEIHCKTKAFCLEACKKKYYEFSNASDGVMPAKIANSNVPPGDEKGIEKNCKITHLEMDR